MSVNVATLVRRIFAPATAVLPHRCEQPWARSAAAEPSTLWLMGAFSAVAPHGAAALLPTHQRAPRESLNSHVGLLHA